MALTGMVALLAGAVPVHAQAPAPVREGLCFLIVKVDGKFQLVQSPGFQVLAGPDQLTAAAPTGTELAAVECLRTTLTPDDRDDRVLTQLSVPFYLGRSDGQATLILEISKGQFRTRMLMGALTPQEEKSIEPKLNLFQRRLNAAAPAAAKGKPQ